MDKRKIGKVLTGIGLIITIIGSASYINIRESQRNLLRMHKEASMEQTPAIVSDTMTQVITSNTLTQEQTVQTKVKPEKEYLSGELVISIPKLKLEAAVMEGTTKEMLKKGPGLYENSPLPGDPGGNVCIAAHRTTYGAWFRHIDKLKKGDAIIVDYEGKTYNYQVEQVFIVDKKDWSITQPQSYTAITLTSCHPLQSSEQRIVVRGKLLD